jgi:hypothetical protein
MWQKNMTKKRYSNYLLATIKIIYQIVFQNTFTIFLLYSKFVEFKYNINGNQYNNDEIFT